MADDLRIFPDDFVPNVQASDAYKRWARSSPADRARWEAFRDALLANPSAAVVPVMSTRFGKALAAAGKEHMSISQLVGQVTNPYPPPTPPPPASGYYWDIDWQSASVPAGWFLEQKAWPPGTNNANAQYAFVPDPFGAGQGTVAQLSIQYDSSLPGGPASSNQRLLSSIYTFEGNAHTARNEETWYRGKIGWPSGTWFSKGEWHIFWEWHNDYDTATRYGVVSPMLGFEGGFPLDDVGTQSPVGMLLVWRAGDPTGASGPTETYWPNNGGTPTNYANAQHIPLVTGRYYDFVWRVIWSDDPAVGYLGWWVDGVSKVNRHMATLYTNPYLPTGVATHGFGIYNYRYNCSGGTSDAYFGTMTAGPTAASIGFVVP